MKRRNRPDAAIASIHTVRVLDGLIARCLCGEAAGAVRAIEQDGLWEYVAVRACQGQTAGFLRRALIEQLAPIPHFVAVQWEEHQAHVAARSAYQASRVLATLSKLNSEGLRWLLLKGAALNATLYSEPGLRGMEDVDVLIHPRDAERVDRLLKSTGCTPGADLVRPDFYPHYYYEREYFTPDRPAVKIDLHVRPFRPLRYARTVPETALWDSPEEATIGGRRVLIPNAENMLIHLAVHAACHGLSQLRWLYDIDQWWRRYSPMLRVDQIVDKCRAWKLEWPMARALRQVQSVLKPCDDKLDQLAASLGRHPRLSDRLILRQAPRDADHPLAGIVVNALTTPDWKLRFGYLKAVLIPDDGHLGQLYPRRHPGWQAAAHGVRAWRSIQRLFQTFASTAP